MRPTASSGRHPVRASNTRAAIRQPRDGAAGPDRQSAWAALMARTSGIDVTGLPAMRRSPAPGLTHRPGRRDLRDPRYFLSSGVDRFDEDRQLTYRCDGTTRPSSTRIGDGRPARAGVSSSRRARCARAWPPRATTPAARSCRRFSERRRAPRTPTQNNVPHRHAGRPGRPAAAGRKVQDAAEPRRSPVPHEEAHRAEALEFVQSMETFSPRDQVQAETENVRRRTLIWPRPLSVTRVAPRAPIQVCGLMLERPAFEKTRWSSVLIGGPITRVLKPVE